MAKLWVARQSEARQATVRQSKLRSGEACYDYRASMLCYDMLYRYIEAYRQSEARQSKDWKGKGLERNGKVLAVKERKLQRNKKKGNLDNEVII